MQNITPKEWNFKSINEIAFVNPSTPLKKSSIAKYIGMENIDAFTRKISRFGKKEFEGGMKFVNGDTLMARITPCLENGKTSYVDILNSGEVGFGSTEYVVFREIEGISDKLFLYYLVSSPRFRELAIRSMTGTSGRQRVQTDLLIKEVMLLPSLTVQKKIADVLSSFDNKIELLKEQNKTLESIAQTIFKEWFVKFNFPGSMGKMIDSELGPIPEGWKITKLDKLVEVVNGYAYKGSDLQSDAKDALVTLKSFDRNGGFQTRGFKPFRGTPKIYHKVILGDLIVAHTDLTQDADVLGNPALIVENGSFDNLYITMDLVKVVSKDSMITNIFFYNLMLSDKFKKHAVGYSNGTTVLHLSKKAIPDYKLALPEDLELCKEYSILAEGITSKIINNFSSIVNLSMARDMLLPKLMKGEIKV